MFVRAEKENNEISKTKANIGKRGFYWIPEINLNGIIGQNCKTKFTVNQCYVIATQNIRKMSKKQTYTS